MKLSKEEFIVFKLNQFKEMYPWTQNITEEQLDKIISNFSYLRKPYNDIDDLFQQIDAISKSTMVHTPSLITLVNAHDLTTNSKAFRVFLPKYDATYLENEAENVPKRLTVSKTIIDILKIRTQDYIKSKEVQDVLKSYIKKYHIRPCRDDEYLFKYAFEKCGLVERNYEIYGKMQKSFSEGELLGNIIFKKHGTFNIHYFPNFTLKDINDELFKRMFPNPINFDTMKFTKDIQNPNIKKTFEVMGRIYEEKVGVRNISVNAFAHSINSEKTSANYYLMRKTWNEIEFKDNTLKDVLFKIISNVEKFKNNEGFQKTKMENIFDLSIKSINEKETITKLFSLTVDRPLTEQYLKSYINKILSLEDKSADSIFNTICELSPEKEEKDVNFNIEK